MGGANLHLAPSHTPAANLNHFAHPTVQLKGMAPSPIHCQSIVDFWLLITHNLGFLLVCFLMSTCLVLSVSVCDPSSTVSDFAHSVLQPQDPALVSPWLDFSNKPLKVPVCPYLHFRVQLHHQRAPKTLAFFPNQDVISVDITQGFQKSVSANMDKGNDCVPSDAEAVFISSDLSQH